MLDCILLGKNLFSTKYHFYLKDGIETLRESVKICPGFAESQARNFPCTKLSPEDLSSKKGEDAQKQKEKDKKGNDRLDRVDQRAKQVLKRLPVPES